MGIDRLERITSKDSVAYLPTILLQWHSSEGVRGKAFNYYFTLDHLGVGVRVGNLQTL